MPRTLILGGLGAAAYAAARSDGARRLGGRIVERGRAARDVAMGRAVIARREARHLGREVLDDVDELRRETQAGVRHIISP